MNCPVIRWAKFYAGYSGIRLRQAGMIRSKLSGRSDDRPLWMVGSVLKKRLMQLNPHTHITVAAQYITNDNIA